MSVNLNAHTQALLEQWLGRGGYATADDVVIAALAALEQQINRAQFEPGELDELLAVADAEIERGDLIDGAQALHERRRRRAQPPKKAG